MSELGQFGVLLHEWRDRVPPPESGPGIASGSRRRTVGLRREELAELSEVSADYIKRLEQGRARPSLQVLKSLARALALTRAEYEHLCILTDHSVAQPGQVNRRIGTVTRELLDRLENVPVVDHTGVGRVRTDGTVLAVPEGDLRLMVFTAEPGSPDAAKLAALRALT